MRYYSMEKATKVIKISLDALNRIQDIITPIKNESMTHYFERVSRLMDSCEEMRFNYD